MQGNINSILSANSVGDLTPSRRNIRGLGNVPGVMRDIRDRTASGYEVEVVANLTRQWRLLLNPGLPKAYEENAFQDTKRYISPPTMRCCARLWRIQAPSLMPADAYSYKQPTAFNLTATLKF